MLKKKDEIEIQLTTYGQLNVVTIPVSLTKDSYNTTYLTCRVPVIEGISDYTLVKVYATGIDLSGIKAWTSEVYDLPYKNTIKINGFDFQVYTAPLPEEFCAKNGDIEITFSYVSVLYEEENDDITADLILPSATLRLYIGGNGFNANGVKISNFDIVASKVNELTKNKVDKTVNIDGNVSTIENLGNKIKLTENNNYISIDDNSLINWFKYNDGYANLQLNKNYVQLYNTTTVNDTSNVNSISLSKNAVGISTTEFLNGVGQGSSQIYLDKNAIDLKSKTLTWNGNQIATLDDIQLLKFEVVEIEELPAVGENGIVYIIKNESGSYDEYIWIASTNKFEMIGSTNIDLSDYYTKNETDVKIQQAIFDAWGGSY